MWPGRPSLITASYDVGFWPKADFKKRPLGITAISLTKGLLDEKPLVQSVSDTFSHGLIERFRGRASA